MSWGTKGRTLESCCHVAEPGEGDSTFFSGRGWGSFDIGTAALGPNRVSGLSTALMPDMSEDQDI
jgi:hypothetical protein